MEDAFSVPFILSYLQPTRGFPVGILTIRKTKLQKKTRLETSIIVLCFFQNIFKAWFRRRTFHVPNLIE